MPPPDEPLPDEVEEEDLGATHLVDSNEGDDTEAARRMPRRRREGARFHVADYRLIRKLGAGAMGIVYKAYEEEFERMVALKVLFPHVAKNQKLLTRFYRERGSPAALTTPTSSRATA